MQPFTIAVLADTHVRITPEDPQACYPSDARMNDRARRVVALAAAREPAFAVHLGDVTHTLPVLEAHGPTQRQARELLRQLGCPLLVAPGNHDVGDKPRSRAAVARTDRAAHDLFEDIWGPPWRSIDHGGCRFVVLDAPIMDTGSELEAEQWAWLEGQLAGAERSFLFLHYPPFLLHADEPPNYDNLNPPARARLLALCEQHGVEAVFAGHVHTFFHHRHGDTELWSLPSTAFCRPEYSELYPVAPGAENGRDDPHKLGFALLHIDAVGHRLEWICPERVAGERPEPPAPAPVGAWLRGGWARVVDLPAGDLDPFDRKRARCDIAELALLELGISTLRVQLADLDDPIMGPRLAQLADRGFRLQVASVGAPTPAELACAARHVRHIHAWEIVLSPALEAADLTSLAAAPVPVALSVIDPGSVGPDGYHSHFPEQGFPVDYRALARLTSPPTTLRWLVFRVAHDRDPWQAIHAAAALAASRGLEACCTVELPRGSEAHAPTDLHGGSRRVAEALLAAAALPRVRVLLDGLIDKDRGYHPRPGLIDRRGNPHPSAGALISLTRVLAGSSSPEALGRGRWRIGDRELWLRPEGEGPWWCLETDREVQEPPPGPALR